MKKAINICLALALLVAAAAGCKKDDDTTKSYLDGSVSIEVVGYDDFPAYVTAGDVFTLIPSGLSADDVDVAYYITNPFTSEKDTIMMADHPGESFVFEISDTLATLAVVITGFAVNSSDYYSSSASAVFTVVDPVLNEGSIVGVNLDDCEKERIGDKDYYVSQIGESTWMRQNLAYFAKDAQGKPTIGTPYYGCSAMEDVFGGYYSWEEAQSVCPEGWHLPSENEWVELLKVAGDKNAQPLRNASNVAGNLMVNTEFNGEKMWNYWGFDLTDKLGFSSLPTAYAMLGSAGYDFVGYPEYACYWTSDEHDGFGVYRYIYKTNRTVYVGFADKTGFLASVRCVNGSH